MTQEEATALCTELEALLARSAFGRSALLRVREIEGCFFADPAADGHLLTLVTHLVDALEEAVSDLRGEHGPAREFLLEGPVQEELERLKTAVAICYGGRDGELHRGRSRATASGLGTRPTV